MNGQACAYQVYVPSDYSAARQWPVIVYLHGNGHQGNDGMQQTDSAMGNSIREKPSLFPAIVLFPQAKPGTRWSDSEMQDLVIAELDKTVIEFHGDPKRLYLTGFSMGGTGTYRIAYHWPEKFAALVVVAGRVQPGSAYTQAEVETDRRANNFLSSTDPFNPLAIRIKGLPLWIFHGDKDEAVPVEQSRKLVAALKNAGSSVRYTDYPGANHAQASEKTYFDANVIQWMLAQHR